MTAEEKNLINKLIENLTQVSGEDSHRDKEAEETLKVAVETIEGSQYYLAQTVIAQTDVIRRLKERLSAYNPDAAEVKLVEYDEVEDEDDGKTVGFIKTAAESAEVVAGNTQFINAVTGVSDDLGYQNFVTDDDEDEPDVIDEDDFTDLDI